MPIKALTKRYQRNFSNEISPAQKDFLFVCNVIAPQHGAGDAFKPGVGHGSNTNEFHSFSYFSTASF